MSLSRSSGYVLMEVLACLFIISIGFLAILSLFLWGLNMLVDAKSRSTGLITAETVLVDCDPISAVHFDNDPNDSTSNTGSCTRTGWLNGYFYSRRETLSDVDVLTKDQCWVEVEVSVYMDAKDEPVASLRRRIIRQGR